MGKNGKNSKNTKNNKENAFAAANGLGVVSDEKNSDVDVGNAKNGANGGMDDLWAAMAALQRQQQTIGKEFKQMKEENQSENSKNKDDERRIAKLESDIEKQKLTTTSGERADILNLSHTQLTLKNYPTTLQKEAKAIAKTRPVNNLHKLQQLPSYKRLLGEAVMKGGDIIVGDIRHVEYTKLACEAINATGTK